MIYLDHAATSPLRREALEAMWPFLTTAFGNPSSHHEIGRMAKLGLDAARDDIAAVLGARPNEVVFTSGGTESNNLALRGIAQSRPRGRHLVISAVEHPAIVETAEALRQEDGFNVTVVGVDGTGRVDPDEVRAALTAETTLCSIMLANNEVGTVQPIVAIAEHCRAQGVLLHTDAVQAPGLLPLQADALGVDLLSLSAHKFGGPRGVGALYVRSGVELTPTITGGGQERGLRSGTNNVAGAVGMATALRLVEAERPGSVPRLIAQRDRLVDGIVATTDALLTGHRTERLANHASFCFTNVSGESVLLELERAGICCSSGSACAAGSDEPSAVLLAMGIAPDAARTAVRFTLGTSTTDDDVAVTLNEVTAAVERLTQMA